MVPAARLAEVLATSEENVNRLAASMGLRPQRGIEPYWSDARGYITVLRRNWHLLPYDQLLTLLGLTREELAWRLIEDDFLFVKLGNVKPACEPLRYRAPDERPASIRFWGRSAEKLLPGKNRVSRSSRSSGGPGP